MKDSKYSQDMERWRKQFVPVYESLAAQTQPRLIKTHLPIPLMPRNIAEVGAKIVYVARNPKDVAVSSYYMYKYNPVIKFAGDFKEFVEYFVDDSSE